MYEIILYEDARRRSSIDILLQDLDVKTDKMSRIKLRQIRLCIDLLELDGTRTSDKFTKHLEDGIYELRPGRVRILFFVWGSKIILLHSFIKTTRKTPLNEIAQAKRERDDWMNRYGA